MSKYELNQVEQSIKDETFHEIDMMCHPAIRPIKYYNRARCKNCGCEQVAARNSCEKCGSYDLEDFVISDE